MTTINEWREETDAIIEELLEDGSLIFCFDASKDGTLASPRIVTEIESLLPLCEKYGVDYDGWGTYFEE